MLPRPEPVCPLPVATLSAAVLQSLAISTGDDVRSSRLIVLPYRQPPPSSCQGIVHVVLDNEWSESSEINRCRGISTSLLTF
ncbi:unnamed protein product [Urochloa humidicola]